MLFLLPLRTFSSLLLIILINSTVADLLGPRYPPPRDLSSASSLVSLAWQNLTTMFTAHLNGSYSQALLSGIEDLTFSVGLFSIHDTKATGELQYHYTSAEIRNASVGSQSVDGDTVYRVASVTKLFTVFAGLRMLSDEQWNRPLTKILPGLAEFVAGQTREGDTQSRVSTAAVISQWEQVTPWALASHLSGVSANVAPYLPADRYSEYFLAVLANDTSAVDPVTWGLPPVVDVAGALLGDCPYPNSSCTGDLYMRNAEGSAPSYLPWTSPKYSNNGLILLGLAISNLTGKSIDQVYREAIFEPLGLTSTNSVPPVNLVNKSVIAGGSAAGFFADQGISKSSGGIFSTLNDLARFSTAILNGTLLPTNLTRKWMKPLSHTASLYYSVGAPWEILRYLHPAGTASAGVVTDLYTKVGDSGFYGGVTVLIPEYGAGFNMIGASSLASRSDLQALVQDAVVRFLLPALEAQAASEASTNFVGTYVSSTPGLNSSLTLAVNSSIAPGLLIRSWISNSTDVLKYQTNLYLSSTGVRLVPTITEVGSGSSQYAFRAIPVVNKTAADAAIAIGPFTGQLGANPDWLEVDQVTYAGKAVDLFVFEKIDPATGKAGAIEVPAFNVTMEKMT